jgi:hypothetical protein
MLAPMKSARPTFISIAITFVIALIFYFVAYTWLTGKQTGKGPWQAVFTNGVAGPELIVAQPQLGISNVHIRFQGETLAATQKMGTVEFTKPKQSVPFGDVIYDDLMFMPGAITLDCFGHEVELLPRVLVLNRKEIAWQSNSTNSLAPSEKLPPETRKRKKGGYRK